MTFDAFVKTYLGKGTDYDGAYGVQCVDLIKLYLDKVFSITPQSIGNAFSYFYNFHAHKFLTDNFIRISNTPSFVPRKGDIAVWNKNKGGGCGHVAICTGEGTTRYFYSYDQNWNGKPMKIVKHNYTDFYGVLRPKNQGVIENNPVNAAGQKYIVVCDLLNVRKGAGTVYGKVKQLPKGTVVTVTSVSGTWGYIGCGWISIKPAYAKKVG